MDDSRLLSILRIGHDTSMRGAGLSLREALVRTQYATVRGTFGPRDLIPLIKRNPMLIDQWVAYSEDKRTSGGWYLTERGEIGTVEDSAQQMRFDSIEDQWLSMWCESSTTGLAKSKNEGEKIDEEALKALMQGRARTAPLPEGFRERSCRLAEIGG